MSGIPRVLIKSCISENDFINELVSLLLKDKIILYPTDTTYALGVNALSENAVNKLFKAKRRAAQKPIHVVVSDLEMAAKYVFINEWAVTISKYYLPGPITLVLEKKSNIPDVLVGGRNTLGIRIPNNKICSIIPKIAKIPITATSANMSGESNLYSVDDVICQLGDNMKYIDFIIDQGVLKKAPPSTVIDLTKKIPEIIREGLISSQEIMNKINKI